MTRLGNGSRNVSSLTSAAPPPKCLRKHVLAGAIAALLTWAGTASVAVSQTVYRPASRTETDTTSITVPYATNGRTRTWGYTWTATGRLLTVDGPLAGSGDTVTYTYNSDGYLATVTNEVGHVTTVTAWNARGHPATVVDPNGVATTLTYDVRDRVESITIDPGADQSAYAFEYDAVGKLTKITRPAGAWLEYAYDSGGRLTSVTNNRGETQTFAVNAVGDPTSVTLRTSGATITAQQTFAYDELGRVIEAIGAGSQTTGLGYDKVDNLKTVTDARGKAFQTAFDALDRVITETNPQSQTVQLAYSPSDQITSHKDGRTLETTRVIDGFGQVIREVSPDRGTLDYWYSAAGKLTKIVDGDGQETNYAYDNAGRLLSATFTGASAETITYSYDSTASGNKGVGRLTGVSEESGSSAFKYDAQGRLIQDVKTIQGQSYTVQYAYNANGEVTQVTLPSGRTVTYARATDGLTSGVTTKATPLSSSETLASSVSYAPFGPLQSLTYGNGLQLTHTLDQNYWLSRIEVKATGVDRLDLNFGRNANGQLTGVTDNLSSGRGATFDYADAGRLITADGAWGDDDYTYDAAGNRTGKTTTVGGTPVAENPVMSLTSNRVATVQQGGGSVIRTLTWRTGGDLSQAVSSAGTYNYDYNARKRLKQVRFGGITLGQYGYDFRGLRVWRTVTGTPNQQHHYIYDPNGRLLAEHDGATGTVLREFAYVDDAPVAVIESSTGTATTYFIHTGQIGEPLIMTDGSKAKVWEGYLEPFGRAVVFNSTPVELGFRLPGQWEDPETGGLHQNWNRDYDPSLGRYIEADPLGIEAGQNIYSYAKSDPLTLTDPTGEFVPAPVAGVIVGGLVGGGFNLIMQIQGGGEIDGGDVFRASVSGAITGGLMMTPWGYTRLGAVGFGALGSFAGEYLNACRTPGSLIQAATAGAIGGFVGGSTRSMMPGRRPLPMHVTDWKEVRRVVLPQSSVEFVRTLAGQATAEISGSND